MADDFKKESLFDEAKKPESKKVKRAQKRYKEAQRRTYRAERNIPHDTKLTIERSFNDETGKVKHRLTTKQTPKKIRKQAPLKKTVKRTVSEGRNFIHAKISENEHDNAGIEAAHKAEEAVEETIRYVRYNRPDKNVRRKKKLKKARAKEIKAGTSYTYEVYLEENPEIRKKILKKRIQKARIKREYARQFRRKAKDTETAAEAASELKQKTVTVAKKLEELAREHAAAIGGLALGGLFFMLIAAVISSCGAMFGGGTSTLMMGAYQSMPADIDAAEDSMKLKEMYLQADINSTEDYYPSYDEYVYYLGHVGHDPFTLINYLSAMYQIFTSWDVESEIQTLFDAMYTPRWTPSVETRTRTVITTIPGDVPGEDIISEEEEEYTVTVMTVTLAVRPLELIVSERLYGNEEATALYEAYGATHGALQRFWSPVNLDWESRISCYYGYRIHPISGDEQFHRGLDIAIPEGTELYASMDGTILYARYDDSYGNYVVIMDENGYSVRYAHMSSLSVTEGQTVIHGDLVGYSGNTGGSTGPHLHLECTYGPDYYNPIFYFLNGTD